MVLPQLFVLLAAFIAFSLQTLPQVDAATLQKRGTPSGAIVTSDVTEELIAKNWTYIIVGAGPAGLTLARRLTEGYVDSNVLLIEAGNDTRKDPKVVKVTEDYGPIFDDPHLNWNYESQPQPFTPTHDTRNHIAGLGLGGGTSINGALFDTPDVTEIDAWKELGNDGWNGQQVINQLIKVQDYHPPQGRAKDFGATSNADRHATGGPLAITFVGAIYAPAHRVWKHALEAVFNLRQAEDTGIGANVNGAQFNPHYILPDESSKTNKNVTSDLVRVSAATGYLSPMEARSNVKPRLTVLTGTRAVRLVLEPDSKQGGQRAVAVQVQQSAVGRMYFMRAQQEIVLSAGVYKSPVLLELSGIGDPKVLSKLNIKPVIELPGVGTNFMDTNGADLIAPINQDMLSLSINGPTPAIAMLPIDAILTNASAVESYIASNIDDWAQLNVDLGHAVNVAGAKKQMQVMLDGIFKQKWPVAELQFFARKGSQTLRLTVNMMQVFTRGSVHADSLGAIWDTKNVNISSDFFAQSIDVDFHVAGLRSARKLNQDASMSTVVTGNETQPGYNLEPQDKDAPPGVPNDSDFGAYINWVNYLKEAYFPYSHAIGTCPMMSKELGGVVGTDFIVHGTSNLRVVDASVPPMQFTAHPTGLIYGLAELASTMILAKTASPGFNDNSP